MSLLMTLERTKESNTSLILTLGRTNDCKVINFDLRKIVVLLILTVDGPNIVTTYILLCG